MAAWGWQFQLFMSYVATQNILQDLTSLSTVLSESAKQPLRMDMRAWSLLKSLEGKGIS